MNALEVSSAVDGPASLGRQLVLFLVGALQQAVPLLSARDASVILVLLKNFSPDPIMRQVSDEKLKKLGVLISSIFQQPDAAEQTPSAPCTPATVVPPARAKPAEIDRLVRLCRGESRPRARYVLAELRLRSSKTGGLAFKDVKDILIKIFLLKPYAFGGVVRNPPTGGFAFLVEENALLQTLSRPSPPDVGGIYPWAVYDLETYGFLVSAICAKVDLARSNNKALSKAASSLLSGLSQRGYFGCLEFLPALSPDAGEASQRANGRI